MTEEKKKKAKRNETKEMENELWKTEYKKIRFSIC